jgi:acyl dehydratase
VTPRVGDIGRRTRVVRKRDIELFTELTGDRNPLHVDWSFRAPVRPGDEITAEVEVLEVRDDKPLTTLRTTVVDQNGTVVLDGTALVWTEPL